ncbi:MAG: protoheme IX farnesyltransferase [Oscillatoriales cyanobacterium SM2_2_1]|nr:protoheme IX farnesyltransferase [Oscillatoriales cyanobacterium SM2_2_1]
MTEVYRGASGRSLAATLQDYLQLTKPRIIVLLLITTVGAMWLAAKGQLSLSLLGITTLGGALSAGAANTFNCIYDRDIDAQMERTAWRPIPAGRVGVRAALLFATVLAIAAFGILLWGANLLAASLAMAGIATYVGVYTFWLKRSSRQNIVIGGAAGAIPPLVGWAAVTGELSWAAWVLFAIIFFWTPPHFWALAMMIREDYAKVGVPMMPVVVGDRQTAIQIFAYTILLLPITILLVYPLHALGWVYLAAALCLWGGFIYQAWQLLQRSEDRQVARSVFKYSILYLGLICLAIAIDSLLPFS